MGEIKSLVSKRSLEVWNLDETVTTEGYCRAIHRAGQARSRRPVQVVQALQRCEDCGGPSNQSGRPELARAR